MSKSSEYGCLKPLNPTFTELIRFRRSFFFSFYTLRHEFCIQYMVLLCQNAIYKCLYSPQYQKFLLDLFFFKYVVTNDVTSRCELSMFWKISHHGIQEKSQFCLIDLFPIFFNLCLWHYWFWTHFEQNIWLVGIVNLVFNDFLLK